MTRSMILDDAHDEIVPPPLDTRIPTDDELDAQCDELMRFDADPGATVVGLDKPTLVK